MRQNTQDSLGELTHDQSHQRIYFDRKYHKADTSVDFDHYSKPRFGPWNPYWFLHEEVKRHYSDGLKLLSLGCGTGADSSRYARMGYQVRGIDISEQAVRVAKESARKYGLEEKVDYSVQAAESLQFDNGSFDIIAGVNVLHHTDTVRVIPELKRVLKPGGMAIFKEPLATPVRDWFRNRPPISWLIPVGVKSIPMGLRYGNSEGEHMLDSNDFNLFRESFGNLTIYRWRVFATMSVLFGKRTFLERLDWSLFRVLPMLRLFGDQAVLVAKRQQ